MLDFNVKGGYMLSESSIYEIKRLGIGILVLSLLMFLIFTMFFGYTTSLLLGTIIGSVASYFNFIFLAISVEKSLENAKGAKYNMGSGYFFRLLFIGVVIYFAITSPYINHWATILPFLFPKFIIMFLSLIDARKGRKK